MSLHDIDVYNQPARFNAREVIPIAANAFVSMRQSGNIVYLNPNTGHEETALIVQKVFSVPGKSVVHLETQEQTEKVLWDFLTTHKWRMFVYTKGLSAFEFAPGDLLF